MSLTNLLSCIQPLGQQYIQNVGSLIVAYVCGVGNRVPARLINQQIERANRLCLERIGPQRDRRKRDINGQERNMPMSSSCVRSNKAPHGCC